MDRSSFRNIYNVCFDLISFIIKIPKIVESPECPTVHTVVRAHVPVFEHSETQYPHGYKSLRPGVRRILGDTGRPSIRTTAVLFFYLTHLVENFILHNIYNAYSDEKLI